MDRTNIKTTKNEFYTFLNSNLLGKLKVTYSNYNYDYSTNIMSETSNKINANENAVSLKFNRNLLGQKFEFDISKNLFGEKLGDFFVVNVSSNKNFNYDLGFSIVSKHPGLYYELYESSYSELNWNNEIKKKLNTNIFLKIKTEKLEPLLLILIKFQLHFFNSNNLNILSRSIKISK